MEFSFRINTKTQTKIKEDVIDYIKTFYIILRKIIFDKNLLLHKENIGNADETPIFIEMNEKKTLSLIGEKDIKVKTFNKTHTSISVLLTILGNGKSLPPFVVFKGILKGAKEKKLKTHLKVRAEFIYVCCQQNSWVDEPSMMIYLNEIWFKEGILKTKKNTLLVMDRSGHIFQKKLTVCLKKIVIIMS